MALLSLPLLLVLATGLCRPVHSELDLGWQFVQSLQQQDDQNVLISPLLLSRALLWLTTEARGQTEQELRHVLNLQPDEDVKKLRSEQEELIQRLLDKNGEDQELTLLTRLLVQRPSGVDKLKETFKRAVKEELKKLEVDFQQNSRQVTKEVNQWLTDGSRGRLTRLFKDDVDEKNSMVLLTAADFSQQPLVKLSPTRGQFNNFVANSLPAMVQQVPFLESSGADQLRSKTDEELRSDLLELPYHKNRSLVFVQPKDEESLQYVTENVTSQQLHKAVQDLLQVPAQPLKVRLPKFKVEFDLELKDVLEDFYDVRTVFNQSLANFTDGQHLTTSLHKAVFELKPDTVKLEADAPSGGDSPQFVLDRPFVFLVKDLDTDQVFLLGKVNHLVDEEALGLGFI